MLEQTRHRISFWLVVSALVAATLFVLFADMRSADAKTRYHRHHRIAVAKPLAAPPARLKPETVAKLRPDVFPRWQHGESSYYGVGDGFAGRETACGIRFIPSAMVAASPTLPCWTIIQVCSGKVCSIATVIDRGPAAWTGRVLDASPALAKRLGFIAAGTAEVDVQVLSGQ